MESIIFGILLGIAIAALGAVAMVQTIQHSKDNRELQKLLKASGLQEYRVFGEEPQEDEVIDEDDGLVELENISTVIGDVNERE